MKVSVVKAESLIYRFCKIDRAKFGEIPNVTDRLYYTNSYHRIKCGIIQRYVMIKPREPRNLGCATYVKELQEMIIRSCANWETG